MSKVVPTKGNLLQTKKTLELAKVGFDLLDRKRNILIREIMSMIDDATKIQESVEQGYKKAYAALQQANVAHGIISEIADSVPEETGVRISSKTVMGVNLPKVNLGTPNWYRNKMIRQGMDIAPDQRPPLAPDYGFVSTSSLVDEAYVEFNNLKQLTAKLAEIENSIYRLATAIKQTQKRANSLKNIVLPNLDKTVKFINSSLEEKEREEFTRLKVIKTRNDKEKQAELGY